MLKDYKKQLHNKKYSSVLNTNQLRQSLCKAYESKTDMDISKIGEPAEIYHIIINSLHSYYMVYKLFNYLRIQI